MNDVKIFENPEFGRVRTTVIDGEPWFVAADVCHALDIGNPSDALNRLDDDERTLVSIEGASNGKPVNGVNEPGLYSLVLGSRKPEAKAFKRWITHEVIPAIRKTGGYRVPQSPAEQMAQGILAAQKLLAERDETIAKQKEQIDTLTPKGIFADSVSASDTTILIGELAKIIKQNGTDMGQNRLFQWLRDKKYLIGRKGTDYNMPTQKAMKLGLFTIKETTINHSDGHVSISKTPKVTGKRQVYFVNKFLRKALN